MKAQCFSITGHRLAFGIAVVVFAVLVGTMLVAKPADAQSSGAPGGPGEKTTFTQADKDGFGTSTTENSKVWYTLDDGRLTEVYYPNLSTPSVRDLQFVVSDGTSFADLESEATDRQVRLVDEHALVYQQINTDKDGEYRITKTYVTDPDRSTQIIGVVFESLTGEPYQLYALYDPALDNSGDDDSGEVRGNTLVATDGEVASALSATPELAEKSTGYLGTSSGLQDLKDNYKLDNQHASSPDGNVVQTARLPVDGVDTQNATLALGFAPTADGAAENAQASLTSGFYDIQANYAAGWHDYLASLKPAPQSVSNSELLLNTYNVSTMMLRAGEDKTYHGASVASPSMPWVWATDAIEDPTGPYHLVWPRDLYHTATAMLAIGDRTGAERALDFLFERQQKDSGSFPQNTKVDGTPFWKNLQLDEVAFPLVLAGQLGRTDETTYQEHVKPAADFIVKNGPSTEQERWEEEKGYSPSTIAAQIAGLVSAADIARTNGDEEAARRYEDVADEYRQKVDDWTFTTTGPLGDGHYYERIDDNGKPNDGHKLELNNSAGTYDEREIVDAGFLELVRLGILPPDDETILASLPEVDANLRVDTPNGPVWHRYNHDGYGETDEGEQWELENSSTIGRAWPFLSGERGEYELAAGRPADSYLQTIANTANEGYMLPEQVWDENPPSGEPGFPTGEGTRSATPLGWTHAQFLRLAWSIDAGYPVEQPTVVAERYLEEGAVAEQMPSTGGPGGAGLLPLAAALILAAGLVGLQVALRRPY